MFVVHSDKQGCCQHCSALLELTSGIYRRFHWSLSYDHWLCAGDNYSMLLMSMYCNGWVHLHLKNSTTVNSWNTPMSSWMPLSLFWIWRHLQKSTSACRRCIVAWWMVLSSDTKMYFDCLILPARTHCWQIYQSTSIVASNFSDEFCVAMLSLRC